jgi:hypothetical protein
MLPSCPANAKHPGTRYCQEATDPEAPFRADGTRDGAPRVAFGTLEHDPEKWNPAFGKDHAHSKSMIPKSGTRFSEKIMLTQKAKHRCPR